MNLVSSLNCLINSISVIERYRETFNEQQNEARRLGASGEKPFANSRHHYKTKTWRGKSQLAGSCSKGSVEALSDHENIKVVKI